MTRFGGRAKDMDEIDANEESEESEAEAEDSLSDSDKEELTNKAIDRQKKLTKQQRQKREDGEINKLKELAAKQ